MPQVAEAEIAGLGGGKEGKVVCETLVDQVRGRRPGDLSLNASPPPGDDEIPAESFRLSEEDVIGWIDRIAVAGYDRDGSARGISERSAAAIRRGNPKLLHGASRGYYAKRNGPIIALPNRLGDSGYLNRSSRRHTASGRFFPKKLGAQLDGDGKSPVLEPMSPKVSCIGRVLSDRDRNRRSKASRITRPGVSPESSSAATTDSFWSRVLALPCCRRRQAAALVGEEPTRSSTDKIMESGESLPAAPPPGLRHVNSFPSGSNPASRSGEVETQPERAVARSGPLPQQKGQGILVRRSLGSLMELERTRDWQNSGPASL
ncbi:unnamed protein product [Spirodela intermedia]|uniref:Uncharacterized protein n=2 Tax=Spirodela intermedia TaxID=51605 RepID=A0A7I8JBK2_SPIIN|nr:unnamed protein product [Spirodela intermedia]CAA6667588.1 unnamed protein product [Spirodela intermedia]CAA7404406.1 unnamed protein product [Spirodela intermedia]